MRGRKVARGPAVPYIARTMNDTYSDAQFRVGRGIKRRRAELGISQKELARRMGRSQQYVSDLESCSSDARTSTLLRLADALETTVSDLLGET